MQVNQQRQKLHDLQNLIDNLGSQDTVSDKAFEDRLKEAEKTIMDLLKEAQASKGRVLSLSCAVFFPPQSSFLPPPSSLS